MSHIHELVIADLHDLHFTGENCVSVSSLHEGFFLPLLIFQ